MRRTEKLRTDFLHAFCFDIEMKYTMYIHLKSKFQTLKRLNKITKQLQANNCII